MAVGLLAVPVLLAWGVVELRTRVPGLLTAAAGSIAVLAFTRFVFRIDAIAERRGFHWRAQPAGFGYVVSALVLGFTWIGSTEQRTMHDSGVPASGVVTSWSWDRDEIHGETVEVRIQLTDGAVVKDLDLGGTHLATGQSVIVTRDPHGRLRPRLGPPPPPPDGTPRTTALVVLALCAGVMAGAYRSPVPADAVPTDTRSRGGAADRGPAKRCGPGPFTRRRGPGRP
ncbi:hypothetical protein [Kitasatospora sp. NPDC057015]|uniref:hypothetical protein n=1 Tax=Kitasatospora sp. NPDC057015 TaxID=3346001 RepID=UPI0036335907